MTVERQILSGDVPLIRRVGSANYGTATSLTALVAGKH